MSEYKNMTVAGNWINHGDPNIVCTTNWFPIFTFFLINYAAHGATVKACPAESPTEHFVALFLALIAPSAGIARALDALIRHPRFLRKKPLQRAARAGALLMVTRTQDWSPEVGDKINYFSNSNERTRQVSSAGGRAVNLLSQTSSPPPKTSRRGFNVVQSNWASDSLPSSDPGYRGGDFGRRIHGIWKLPPGYQFVGVPADAILINNLLGDEQINVDLSCSYNVAKTLIAFIQAISSAYTLNRARGDQIDYYGYASFGLTVVPYLTMSILNLAGELVCPTYPALYIVHSDTLEEAKSRGGIFDGVVGSLSPSPFASSWVVEKLCQQPPTDSSRSNSDTDAATLNNISTSLDGEVQEQSSKEEGVGQSMNKDEGVPASCNMKDMEKEISSTEFMTLSKVLPGNLSERVTFEYTLNASNPEVVIPGCSPFGRYKDSPKQWATRAEPLWEPTAVSDRAVKKLNLFNYSLRWGTTQFYGPWVVVIIALSVVGGLSGFQCRESTKAQKVWTMTWLSAGLCLGQFNGPITNAVLRIILMIRNKWAWRKFVRMLPQLVGLGLIVTTAVGGFVTVGEELSQYGVCTHIY